MIVRPKLLFAGFLFCAAGCVTDDVAWESEAWGVEDIRSDEWISTSRVMLKEEIQDYVDGMRRDGWRLISVEAADDIPGRFVVRMKKPDMVRIRQRRTKPLTGSE